MWHEPGLIFQHELGADERLLWSGRPKQGLMLRAADIFLIPFSLLWGGFVILWEIGVIASGAPFCFWLWGIPFVFVGLYLILGRFFVDIRLRSKTNYALTNERIIILSGLFNNNVKSVNLRTLADINLTEKRDGTGTITFGPTHPLGGMWAGSGWPGGGRYASPMFEMIDHVRDVYDRIREAQRNA